ncbi:MAG: DUF2092 domain-containing protein, partial [Bacteroidota bacterium]|nr:DUF2092 domain-containing protein [Bacteroidota bacterium]
FYPSFVDDLLSESKNPIYLGITKVSGKEFFHIAGIAKDKPYQFWISNDAFTLPLKMVIVYANNDMTRIPDGVVEQDIDGQTYLVFNNTYFQPVSENG